MKSGEYTSDPPSRPVPLYDALAADYDCFVNWEARLVHELPFFERLFEEHGVSRVLDTACGTGHHAIALARRSYRVVGTDLSAAMIERARQNAAALGLDIPFFAAGLGELSGQAGFLSEVPWDAALCLGNSLPHLLTSSAVERTLADFVALLRPGGLLLIQNRNFDRVWTERQRFMDPQSHRGPDGERVFVRFYDFHPDGITFNMIRLRRTDTGWVQDVDATELRPILREDLAAALKVAGFHTVTLYGGYDRSPFDPASSGDLIALAIRQ
jgi:SAM-dependent methyltransferase